MKARITVPKKSYVISASLGKGCYRHIKISAAATLYSLAEAILDAFDFDNDHLHAFFLDNSSWSDADSYYLEPDHGQRDTTKYTLAQAGFEKDLKFVFLFDFGDEWEFRCKILKELDEAAKEAEILRSVGDAPKQYPDYYNDEFEVEEAEEDAEDDSVVVSSLRPQKINYNENGYVIREHNLFSGETYYKGKKNYSKTKTGITMCDTYTLKGAKTAITNINLRSRSSDTTQYSIERLDECYIRYDNEPQSDEQYKENFQHAMKRLNELIDGNDFDNGDKMRINEVRKVLQDFITELTENKEKQ